MGSGREAIGRDGRLNSEDGNGRASDLCATERPRHRHGVRGAGRAHLTLIIHVQSAPCSRVRDGSRCLAASIGQASDASGRCACRQRKSQRLLSTTQEEHMAGPLTLRSHSTGSPTTVATFGNVSVAKGRSFDTPSLVATTQMIDFAECEPISSVEIREFHLKPRDGDRL